MMAPFLPLVGDIEKACEPAVIPTQITSGTVVINGAHMVVLQIANAAGVNFVFLTPEIAHKVGDNILTASKVANPQVPFGVGIIGADAEMVYKRAEPPIDIHSDSPPR
jgi:hypothetical protein